MRTIIQQATTQCNNYFNQKAVCARYLPPRAFSLLVTLKEDHDFLDGAPSQRPMDHYARRYGVSDKTIQNDFAYLESLGLAGSSPGGRGNPRKRWITCEGISYLVDQASGYTSTYNQSIPYIDLSEKEVILTEIINQQENCGQLDAESKLDQFLDREHVDLRSKLEIKRSLNKARIGPERLEKVIDRVIVANRKKRIGNKRNYLLACLHKEEKKIKELKNYFADKKINFNLYASP